MLSLRWITNKSVVDHVNTFCVDLTEYGALIDYCRELLHSKIGCSVSFTRRQANRNAHSLARAAISFFSSYVFHLVPTYNVPSFGFWQ